ncbi:MAG: hypothetical protein AAGG68_22345 [Bacteroidota bacterium]
MNRFTTILLLLPSFVLGQYNNQSVGEEEYNFEAMIFNLESKTIDTLELAEKSIIRHTWIGKENTSIVEYRLKSSTYPADYINSDSSFQLIEGFLNSTISDLIENPNYEYVSSSLEFISGYPGKDFKFKDLSSNSLFNSKSYLITHVTHLFEKKGMKA